MIIVMNEWWIWIIWFFPCIFLHELGHYVGFRMFGIRPKIELKWWGVFIGESKDLFKMNQWQFGFVGYLGILSGFIYTIIFGEVVMLIYIMMCFIDGVHIFNVWRARRWYGSYGDFLIDMLHKDTKELMDAKWER